LHYADEGRPRIFECEIARSSQTSFARFAGRRRAGARSFARFAGALALDTLDQFERGARDRANAARHNERAASPAQEITMLHLGTRSLAPLVASLAIACASQHAQRESDWKPLFDGKSLNGWVTRGGHYDGDARWTVENGAITGRQGLRREGGLIYTDRMYANFELELDCKCDWPFDSGIFVRMVPEEKGAQITIDDRPDGELGAIYSDGFLKHNTDGWKLFDKSAWNHFRVECSGRDYAIRAWCNGALLCEYRMPEGSTGYAPTGRIGLQVHGGESVPLETKVQFKNIRLRELPVADEPLLVRSASGATMLSQKALIEGWRPLFDGKTLDQWDVTGPKEGVEVVGGTIRVTGGDGELRSKGDYRDFELLADFQISPLSNSGVFLRAERSDKNPAFSGCEVQILDDYNWEAATKSKLHPWQFCGSLYGSVPPQVHGVLKLAPEWNTYHITYRGTRLRTELNGALLYDVDTTQVPIEEPGTLPFAERAKSGYIGLQRHASAKDGGKTFTAFRNLYVRRL
jgi:hypothetical protein